MGTERGAADRLGWSEEHELSRGESEQTYQKLRQKLTEVIAEQRIVVKALVTVKRLKDRCPTCGQPVSAGAKARESERRNDRLAELEELIQEIRKQLSE